MTKTLGLLIVLCSIAAACGSAATTTTVPEPAANAESIQDPAAEPADTTTAPEPEADPEPAQETSTTTPNRRPTPNPPKKPAPQPQRQNPKPTPNPPKKPAPQPQRQNPKPTPNPPKKRARQPPNRRPTPNPPKKPAPQPGFGVGFGFWRCGCGAGFLGGFGVGLRFGGCRARFLGGFGVGFGFWRCGCGAGFLGQRQNPKPTPNPPKKRARQPPNRRPTPNPPKKPTPKKPAPQPQPQFRNRWLIGWPADPEAPAGEWIAGINAAGWDFHRHLTGNAVSSPVSIGVTFSLSRAGASADSGAALDQIFGFPAEGLHDAANAVGLKLAEASVEPTTLEVANRLFPDDEFSPRPEFLDIAATHYGAIVEPIDTANADAAADTINRWASQSTRGLIPRIVDADAVQNQQLVLANTVYLKADWLRQFLAEDTGDGQVHTGDGQSVTVPFMRDRAAVQRRFVRLEGADAVELPYQGGQLAMWLIVPHSPAGLAAVEESLDAETLTGMQGAAQSGRVHVTMPKWEQTLPPTDLFGWLCPKGSASAQASTGSPPASSSPPRFTAPR